MFFQIWKINFYFFLTVLKRFAYLLWLKPCYRLSFHVQPYSTIFFHHQQVVHIVSNNLNFLKILVSPRHTRSQKSSGPPTFPKASFLLQRDLFSSIPHIVSPMSAPYILTHRFDQPFHIPFFLGCRLLHAHFSTPHIFFVTTSIIIIKSVILFNSSSIYCIP